MQIGFHDQCLNILFNFNQAWKFSKDFSNPLFNFTKILVSEAKLFHVDW